MKFLHQDKENFTEALNFAAYQSGFMSQAVELDYYENVFIRELTGLCPFLALKGGTALSMCYRVIGRTVGKVEFEAIRHLSDDELTLIENGIKRLSDKIGFNTEDISGDSLADASEKESFKEDNSRHFRYKASYKSFSNVFSPDKSFEVSIEILNNAIEAGISKMPIDCAVYKIIEAEAPAYVEEYGISDVKTVVRDMDVILAEKIFDICDNYLLNSIRKNSADIYDAYMLLPLVGMNELFYKTVDVVRAERKGSAFHPSADSDVDINELLYRIVKEEAFKQDYNDLTSRLLETVVSYDDAASAIYTIADSGVFGS